MAYVVIKAFVDLQDGRYRYEKGDKYPRKGKRATKKRISELASSENRRGEPMIKEVEDEEE